MTQRLAYGVNLWLFVLEMLAGSLGFFCWMRLAMPSQSRIKNGPTLLSEIGKCLGGSAMESEIHALF